MRKSDTDRSASMGVQTMSEVHGRSHAWSARNGLFLGFFRWHLSGAFAHGAVDVALGFDDGFLHEAAVDGDGHLVRLVRVTT